MKNIMAITSTLRSLNDSTFLVVSLRGETFRGDGLNSPYVSHRVVNIDNGHGIERVVSFHNDNFKIIIADPVKWRRAVEATKELDVPENTGYADFPGWPFARILEERFHMPAPRWMQDPVLVWYQDNFVGFDEDGNPRYGEFPRLWQVGFPVEDSMRHVPLSRYF